MSAEVTPPMTRNMGATDRKIRVVTAMLIGVLLLTDAVDGAAALVLEIVAVTFLMTSVLGVCLAYVPLRITTVEKE
jgi:hypothetical protein